MAPLSLALGVLLLVYAVHLWGWPATRTGQAGRAAGRHWAAVAQCRRVTGAPAGGRAAGVYSERSLSLHAPGVQQTRCRDHDAAYRFRYDGLKLVLQSGDQYLFLPEGSPSNGVAILLPRSDSLRLEFVPAAASGAGQRPAC